MKQLLNEVKPSKTFLDHFPPAEKSRQKAESGERYRAEWMGRQPATPKQMMFLRQLGHRGPVGDRQKASAEIERRLAGGG